MPRRDRIIGIALGAILGVAIVTAFVFEGSRETIDEPAVKGNGERGGERQGNDRLGGRPPAATIRVLGGAPPRSGPAQLSYRRGELVRLRVISDSAVRLELRGYRITRTVSADRPTPIRFTADKRGSFPLIVVPSHVGVAEIRVQRRSGL